MIHRRLPLPASVALRYLRSTRKDAYISFLSLSAMGGICMGVAALILALAALNGFQSALREETLARTPHLEIGLSDPAELAAVRKIVSTFASVEEAQATTRGRAWIVARGRARAAEMVGFQGALPREFPQASERRPGLYLSDRLVESWGLAVGEVVEVASSRPTLTPFGPQPRVRRLALRGTYTSGRSEQIERVALPLDVARGLTTSEGVRLVVRTTGLEEALRLAPLLEAELPPEAEVRTWEDLNRSLLFALRLEKTLMFIAVFLIVIVAAMALISDLMLILASKRSEIGMLRAMGLRPSQVQAIFTWLGGLLVLVGSALGLILGASGAWILDRYRLLSLPDQVYFLDHVPFSIRPIDLVWIVGATWLLATICTLAASRRAGILSPLEALRR